MRLSEGVVLGLEIFGSCELTVSSTSFLGGGGGGDLEAGGSLAAAAPSDAEGL